MWICFLICFLFGVFFFPLFCCFYNKVFPFLGWVMTPLVEKQVAARAEKDHVSTAEAKNRLLLEKQPSGEMATPEQV